MKLRVTPLSGLYSRIFNPLLTVAEIVLLPESFYRNVRPGTWGGMCGIVQKASYRYFGLRII